MLLTGRISLTILIPQSSIESVSIGGVVVGSVTSNDMFLAHLERREERGQCVLLLVLCDWTDLWSTDPVTDGRQGVGALVGEIAVVVVRTGLVVVVRVMLTPGW